MYFEGIPQGLSWLEIRELLGTVRTLCRVEPLTLATHERMLDITERYGFSVYDSMIVAAALLANCRVLWTEDLQDGQRIEAQLIVNNPFAAS